jgi:hypothetical protein
MLDPCGSACSLPTSGLQHAMSVGGAGDPALGAHRRGRHWLCQQPEIGRRKSLARSWWGRAAVGRDNRMPHDPDSTEWEQPFRSAAPSLSTQGVDKWWIHLVRYVYAAVVQTPLCRPGRSFSRTYRVSSCSRTRRLRP